MSTICSNCNEFTSNPVTRRLFVAATAFTSITTSSSAILDQRKITNTSLFLNSLEKFTAITVHEFCYIEKCNAVIIIASVTSKSSDYDIYFQIRKIWSDCTNLPHNEFLSNTTFLNDRDALQYLIETSVGLHSVVPGDSQVYSQIRKPLRKSAIHNDPHSQFTLILKLMSQVGMLVKKHTGLQKGLTSLERLACHMAVSHPDFNGTIVVIGLGDSGRLITKILTEIKNNKVYVTSRSQSNCEEMQSKYNAIPLTWLDLSFLDKASVVIFALSNNDNTIDYANTITGKLTGTYPVRLIIDMATPSIITTQNPALPVIDLRDLSIEANKVIHMRHNASLLARTLIEIHLDKTLSTTHVNKP